VTHSALDPITAYVAGVIFLATLIRSTIGFGEALVAVPLLALRTPVAVAAPLAVLVSILVAGVVVVQDWKRIELRSARGLVLTALPGIPLGVLLLAAVNDHVVRLILGLVIIGFSVYALTMGRARRLEHDHPGWLVACGFLSGVLGGAYGMNGPPLAVYGALRRWTPRQFRATLQGYFLPVSLVGLAGYLYVGLWDAAVTRDFLWSLPGVALAIVLGRALNRRIQGDRFARFLYLGLVLIGAVLLIQAMTR
jgi:uncharacterized membrane protein YfcA